MQRSKPSRAHLGRRRRGMRNQCGSGCYPERIGGRRCWWSCDDAGAALSKRAGGCKDAGTQAGVWVQQSWAQTHVAAQASHARTLDAVASLCLYQITPFMCRLASSAVGGMPEPTSPNVADASERAAVAYATAIGGAAAAQPLGGASTTPVVSVSASSPVVPALILELGVPYEGKDLASRLQRDYMILSNIPSIVTMFDLSG